MVSGLAVRSLSVALSLALACAMLSFPQTLRADDYPSHPIKLLVGAEKTSGSNPEIARQSMSRVLNRNLGPVEGINPKVPFSMQLAEVMQGGGAPQAPRPRSGRFCESSASPASLR